MTKDQVALPPLAREAMQSGGIFDTGRGETGLTGPEATGLAVRTRLSDSA
jgi:hypothetical protein